MPAEAVTAPTQEPISMELAWAHLNIDSDGSPESSPFDVWLEEIGIPGARHAAEQFTGRSFARKVYKIRLDAFPEGGIELEMPPAVSITSVVYVDADGAEQTMDASAYFLDDRESDSWLMPAYGSTWPATLATPNAVTVTYVAGYAADMIPPAAKQAIALTLGHAFRNREASTDKQMFELPLGIENLLRPLRVRKGMA